MLAPDLETPPNAKMWLGVAKDDVGARGAQAWWCVPKDAGPGDLLFLYQSRVGIRRVERLISRPADNSRCERYRLLMAETEFLLQLARPISLQELRDDPVLRDLGAVRRSLQGTCFPVPASFWSRLKTLLAANRRA